MEVAAAVVVGLEVAGAVEREPGLGRRRQVGGAADAARARSGATAFRTLPDDVAAGHALRVGGEGRDVRVPALGQLAVLHRQQLVG